MTRLQQAQELLDRQARLPDDRPQRPDRQLPVERTRCEGWGRAAAPPYAKLAPRECPGDTCPATVFTEPQ